MNTILVMWALVAPIVSGTPPDVKTLDVDGGLAACEAMYDSITSNVSTTLSKKFPVSPYNMKEKFYHMCVDKKTGKVLTE